MDRSKSSSVSRKRRRSTPIASRKLTRADAPVFGFEPLRTPASARLLDPTRPLPKCTVIVAPVGYGKTVLMSQVLADLRRTGRHCLWCGLDDRDTGIENLATNIEDQLHGPLFIPHPTQALFQGGDSEQLCIDAVIERANNCPLPIVLFIDNLQYCTDPALDRLLAALTFNTRPTVQLVLTSSRDLPLDVARAQLEGLLLQIGPKQLSFGTDEVAALLGPELSERIATEGVDVIARKSEGWPAAVRMAQIILSTAPDVRAALAAFSGSDATLGQLLDRQVVSGFPAPVRWFLFCLAQLRTFCAELCNYAIDALHAHRHLQYLIECNVFVIPLDRNRGWYRFHGLFRDHLLSEASTSLSARRRKEVLTRAARWCAKQERWQDAVDYALAAGSIGLAVEIIERIAPAFVREGGAMRQYIAWLETVHKSKQQAGPEAEYWFVWALAVQRRYGEARRLSAKLSERMQRNRATGQQDVRRRVAVLRAALDFLTDHLEAAHRGAAEWLSEAEPQIDDALDVTCVNCIESCHYTNAWRFAEATTAIMAAREAALSSNTAHEEALAWSFQAVLAKTRGSYAALFPEFVDALSRARAALGDQSDICGTMALIASRIAVGMGLDADARQLLEYGRQARPHNFLDAAACGMETALLLWSGNADEITGPTALRSLANAYPPRLGLMLSCCLVRRLTALGRNEEARSEAARIGFDLEGGAHARMARVNEGAVQIDSLFVVMQIELLIAGGNHDAAKVLIEAELQRATQSQCYVRMVELVLDSATIALNSGKLPWALRHITRAIRIAAAHRIVRPFDDHANTLSAAVAQSDPGAWSFASEEERRFFADVCRRIPSVQNVPGSAVRSSEQPRLFSSLTAREFELLTFLDLGMSNQQLAERVNVSLTTVKWHLRNLYCKLGVSSRSAAMARARSMKLLPR